jgi:hypothetical protein
MRRRQQGIESPWAPTAGARRLASHKGGRRPAARAPGLPCTRRPCASVSPARRVPKVLGARMLIAHTWLRAQSPPVEASPRRSTRCLRLSAALDSRLEASHTGLDPRGAPLLRGCVRQPKQCSGAGLLSPVRAQVMLSRNSLTGTDVNEATLGRVPNAASATNAGTPTRWTASTRPPSSARTPRPAATSPAPTPTRPSPTAP